MTARRTAQTRPEAIQMAALELVRLINDAKTSKVEFAERLHRTETVVRRMCDWEEPTTFNFADALLESTPDSVALGMARYIKQTRRPPGAKVIKDDFEFLSMLLEAQHATELSWLDSIKDRVLEPREIRGILSAIRKLRPLLDAAEDRLAPYAETGDSVRRSSVPPEPVRMVGKDRGSA